MPKKIFYPFFVFLILALVTGCDNPSSSVNLDEVESQFIIFSNSQHSTDINVGNLIDADLLEESQINFKYENKIKGISANISDQQAERLTARGDEGPEIIPGKFIIVFNDPFDGKQNVTEEGNKWSMETIKLIQFKYDISDEKISHRYGYVIFGFAAELSDEQLFELDSEELISRVSPDVIFNIGD
jgi:hypothetical protein